MKLQLHLFKEWHRKTGYLVNENIGYRGKKFDPYCFQRQLRDSKDNGQRLGLDGVVSEIAFQEAQKFILQYEWLGTMGTTKYSFGFYVESILTGVRCPLIYPLEYAIMMAMKLNNGRCKQCGKLYERKTEWQKYCSQKCANHAYWKRKIEKEAK